VAHQKRLAQNDIIERDRQLGKTVARALSKAKLNLSKRQHA
jgi:hypothetical protein